MRRFRAPTALLLAFGLVGTAALMASASHDIRCGTRVVIHLTSGNDNVEYEGGNQCPAGLAGNDTILMGAGNDWGEGGPGIDVVKGESGDDSLIGNQGNDTLYGGPGRDFIAGYENNDIIYDGPNGTTFGDDVWGDAGDDTVYHCHDGNQSLDTFHGDIEHHFHGAQYC